MNGQIVLITGAGSGFGRTTAIERARAGHIVYASMRRDDLEGHSVVRPKPEPAPVIRTI